MATIKTTIKNRYSDLDLNFTVHPVKKDINKHTDEMAVINAVKNLILTNHYERPFQPELGSNVRKLLFENLDIITAAALEKEITQTLNNFEPRVAVLGITVSPDFDNNSFNVTLQFSIINRTEPVTISFLLERIR
jgi:phage baseplate assembly protein W